MMRLSQALSSIRVRSLPRVGIGTVVILVISLMGSIVRTPPAFASGTIYYINNQASSNCSNAGAHSQSQPWCDFTNVNTTYFQPGDQILLARGSTWNTTLVPDLQLHGVGSASAPIIVSAYGSGGNPVIRGNDNASDRTIIMYDPSNWSVSNLEISNAGEGIIVDYTTIGNSGLTFSNINAHDLNSIWEGSPAQTDFPGLDYSHAIQFYGSPSVTSSQSVVSNIQISNVEVTNGAGGFSIASGTAGTGATGTVQPNRIQNLVIENCYLHDLRAGALGMANVSHVTVMDTRVNNVNTQAEPQGTTGVFAWQATDVTYVNDMITNLPNTNSTDESGIDTEAWDDQFHYHGDYLAGNAGPGLEWLALSGRNGDYNTNHDVSSNTFSGNATAGSSTFKGSLFYLSQTGNTPFSGTATDNLYYEPSGFTSGDFSGWTLTNNTSIADSTNIYNAAQQFSDTQSQNQWSYEYWDGSSWSLMSYDSATGQWTSGTGASISQFDETPDTCQTCLTARIWTAPQTGTISIRGWVLKNTTGGNGVNVAIVKNATWLLPNSGYPGMALDANDQTGFATNVDTTVNQGDSIIFLVDDGSSTANDIVSWNPSIAYTSASIAFDNASFETPSLGTGSSAYAYQPSGASWSFDPATGIQANGSAFTTGGSNAPDGTQAAFIQSQTSGATGCVSQTVNNIVTGHTYSFTFSAAQRGNGQGGQSIQVYMDVTPLGNPITPSGTTYQDYTSGSVAPGVGTSHVIKFCGTVTGGDHTAFIDNIRINQ